MRLPARYVWLCGLVLAGQGVFAVSAQTAEHPRLMAQVASGPVIACAYSPDSRTVLTGGREGVARLWDAATGAELQSFQGETWIRDVAFSTDRRKVLAVSSVDDKIAVQLWDAATGKELGRISPPAGKLILGIASPDGGTIATANPATAGTAENKSPASATKIQFWDLVTGKELKHFLVPGVPASGALLVLSPDGSMLFSGDFNGPRLWDVEAGKLLWQFGKSEEVVNAAAFSADGHWVAWGTIPGNIQLWDVETGKEVQHFAGSSSADFVGVVESVAISPDGRRVLTATNEGRARVWDVATGKDLLRIEANDDRTNATVNCAAYSPDGRAMLTASDDKTARLWDVETGKELHRLVGTADEVAALAFVADGQGIVAVSRTGMAWKWDADGGKALPLPIVPANPDPPSLAVASGSLVAPVPVRIGDERYVSVVDLSADGRRVLLSGFHGVQGVWDIDTGKEIQSFDWKAAGSFFAADFSPDGHKLLTSNDGAWASLWDVETGKEIKHFTVDPGFRPRLLYPEGDTRDTVARLALSPDGRRALTSDWEGSTRLWDVNTGDQVRVFKAKTYNLSAVGFSPDGSRMITENADKTSSLRNVKWGSEVQHFARASQSSFSKDGSRVLMGMSVWDVKTGKELRHFDAPFGVESIDVLSPDGRKVLIGGGDGTTKLFDVETGTQLASLYGFQDGSWAVVDSDGRFDTDKIDGNIALHWVVYGDKSGVLPLAAFKGGHYTPGLLKKILAGEKLPLIQ